MHPKNMFIMHCATAKKFKMKVQCKLLLLLLLNNNRFLALGFCPGQPGWASTRKNIHPLTPIVVINHPLFTSSIYYDPWHPPCSIYMPDSLFAPKHCLLFAAHAHTI